MKNDLFHKIMNLWKKGWTSPTDIAEELECSKGRVSQCLSRAREQGLITGAPVLGRPRITNQTQDQRLGKIVLKNWSKPLAYIGRMWGAKVSTKTLKRRVREQIGWQRGKASRRTRLQVQHLRPRLEWALEYKNWTEDDWNKVLWSDEKVWTLSNKGTVWIFRPIGQHENPEYQVDEWRVAGQIRVWACFGRGRLGTFVFLSTPINPDLYIRLLEDHALPTAKRLFGRWWYFQDDNDGTHRAPQVEAWKSRHKVRSLSWAASSPDLAPMENVFSIWRNRVQARYPTTLRALKRYIQEEWESIPTWSLENICNSMPARLEALEAAGGRRIRY